MTRCTTLSFAVFISVQSASAFVPAAATAARAPSTTAFNLVPEEGRQLVAFSQDYFAKKAKESASKASHLSSPRRSSSSSNSRQGVITALVTRLVGKDSRTNMSHTHHADHHADYEVMYPIVGFNLVEGRALPCPGQEAACKLHLTDKEEEIFGFWVSTQGGDALWL